ncbi:MAG TPA: radical SAM family heme chaperone HemW [Thermoanaerobaculia bacterium]|nr:radical SAM family heme chaperone HemW [Thermoanaerobaculia bacterium]
MWRPEAEVLRAGLYLHLPFCSAICPYCDFSVLTGTSERRERFVDTLRREITLWAKDSFPGTPFDSIYLGGGTPSLFTPDQLAAILNEARQRLPIAAGARLSMEANPEDVIPASVAAWRQLGVDTLTLGVQSFDDAALRFLGRRHSGEESRRAIEVALGAGFDVVGVDLIYGLPGQDEASWERQLATAAELAPQHLSCYQLTIHDGTPFGFRQTRGELREMSESGQATLFRLTHERLAAAGYHAYEVSNFARAPEHESVHNRKYWRHAPYLGLGPSAHSFDGSLRWWNHRKVFPWEAALAAGELPQAGQEELTRKQLAFEHVMLGLRTREGVDLARLRGLGFDLAAANAAVLDQLVSEGLLRVEPDRLLPTLAGWAVAEGLAVRFDLVPAS